MSLSGNATGATRAAIITEAKSAASAYYGTECVAVELSNEQCEYTNAGALGMPSVAVTTSYVADWVAEVQHRWEAPAYGFPKCIRCKIEHRK